MIADLLQAGKRRQDDSLALNAIGGLNRVERLLDHRGVKRHLLFGQRAEYFHLQLFGQIPDDRFIGLQSPQNKRASDFFSLPARPDLRRSGSEGRSYA